MLSALLVFVLLAGVLTITAVIVDNKPAYATPTLVQKNQAKKNSGTLTVAFPSPTTAGNLIVGVLTFDSSGGTTYTCSDTEGNTFTKTVLADHPGDQALVMCWAANIASGTDTVTLSGSGGPCCQGVIIAEYSGVATTSPLDTSAQNGGATGTTAANNITSTASTTGTSGDLIVGGTEDVSASASTITAGTGFTQQDTSPAGNNSVTELAMQDQIQSSAGSIASTMTFGHTGEVYDAGMLAFKPAAAAAPSTPTSLAQYKSNGSTSIAIGGWSNDTGGVVFKATVSDPGSAQVKLCVENTSGSFTSPASPSTCGSLVNSGLTASVSVTGLTTNTQYRWQVKAENASGTYSAAYAQFNSGSLSYGYDTTLPTNGTVYDGSSAGAETIYNNGSLSSLSCNWSGFADTSGSGLASYDYSLGTTAGGTDIATWANVSSATTSATVSSLTLRTSKMYFCNVRAYDNAGNVSASKSSAGQLVAPTLTFSTSTTTLSFARLNAGDSFSNSQSMTLTTSTNAYGGYALYAYETGPLSSASSTIADYTAPASTPTAWPSGTGFGYTISGGSAASAFSGSKYAHFGTSASPDTPVIHSGPITGSPISSEVETVTVKATGSGLTLPGTYTTRLVWSAVAVP